MLNVGSQNESVESWGLDGQVVMREIHFNKLPNVEVQVIFNNNPQLLLN